MTPEQYETFTAKLETIAARQAAISAKCEATQALLIVGITIGVLVLVLCVIILFVKRNIYEDVLALLATIKKLISGVDELLRINKEYIQHGDMKRAESRAEIVDTIKSAVGEGIQQAAGGPLSSDSIPRPVLPTE